MIANRLSKTPGDGDGGGTLVRKPRVDLTLNLNTLILFGGMVAGAFAIYYGVIETGHDNARVNSEQQLSLKRQQDQLDNQQSVLSNTVAQQQLNIAAIRALKDGTEKIDHLRDVQTDLKSRVHQVEKQIDKFDSIPGLLGGINSHLNAIDGTLEDLKKQMRINELRRNRTR